MIYFPNAKINIGLFVTEKREDGFHNIESVFYPIGLNDALEMRISKEHATKLYLSGENIAKNIPNNEDNIVLKAFNLLKNDYPQIKNVNICLDKRIPVFAGLGGGSSDAVYCLKLTNYMFNLQLTKEQMYDYATKIGSDCAFFLENRPQFVYSRGESMKPLELCLKGYYLLLVKPPLNISTKEAYSQVHLTASPFDLHLLDVKDINNWKNYVRNDFEVHLFETYPLLKQIKDTLYNNGAVFAQMSGSGSTIYGIFDKKIETDKLNLPTNAFVYWEELK